MDLLDYVKKKEPEAKLGDTEDEGMDLQAQLVARLAEKTGVENPEALVKLVKVIVKSCMQEGSASEEE